MKKLTGKEARYILKQHRVNLAELAEKLGIKPQSLNSRLNADEFSYSRMLEVNHALGENVFEVDDNVNPEKVPILDIRASAGILHRSVDEGKSPDIQLCKGDVTAR